MRATRLSRGGVSVRGNLLIVEDYVGPPYVVRGHVQHVHATVLLRLPAQLVVVPGLQQTNRFSCISNFRSLILYICFSYMCSVYTRLTVARLRLLAYPRGSIRIYRACRDLIVIAWHILHHRERIYYILFRLCCIIARFRIRLYRK